MKESIRSKFTRGGLILTLLVAGCATKSTPTPTAEAEGTRTPTTFPEGPDFQATIDALKAQLTAQAEKPMATAIVVTATKEVVEPECPQAAELGPWAPNNGIGEDFEVTANEQVSSGVHVQLWWPAGSNQEWEKKEISVFIPPGLSVEVQDGAGRGWEYNLTCSQEQINTQMDADHLRRAEDTNYWGIVDIDKLIETGLAKVRFDRRPVTLP
jgi:hypothetical protein